MHCSDRKAVLLEEERKKGGSPSTTLKKGKHTINLKKEEKEEEFTAQHPAAQEGGRDGSGLPSEGGTKGRM